MSSDSRLSDGIIQLQFWSPLSLATVFVVMVVICGISGLRYNIFLHGPHQSFQTKIATANYKQINLKKRHRLKLCTLQSPVLIGSLEPWQVMSLAS